MKYFKNKNNTVFAYENDGSQDFLITDDMIAISESEAMKFSKPTEEDLILQNEAIKKSMIYEANQIIAFLQDAIDLDMAEDGDEERLKSWKKYRVLVNRIDIEQAPNIDWPNHPNN